MPTKAQLQEQLKRERELAKDLEVSLGKIKNSQKELRTRYESLEKAYLGLKDSIDNCKREREFTADLQKRYDKLLVANAGYTANYKEYERTKQHINSAEAALQYHKHKYDGLTDALRIVIDEIRNGK